jgi:hypothetical protein
MGCNIIYAVTSVLFFIGIVILLFKYYRRIKHRLNRENFNEHHSSNNNYAKAKISIINVAINYFKGRGNHVWNNDQKNEANKHLKKNVSNCYSLEPYMLEYLTTGISPENYFKAREYENSGKTNDKHMNNLVSHLKQLKRWHRCICNENGPDVEKCTNQAKPDIIKKYMPDTLN